MQTGNVHVQWFCLRRFRVVTLEKRLFLLAEKMTEHVVNGLRAMLAGLIFEQIELAEQEGHESSQYTDTIVPHNVIIRQTFGKNCDMFVDGLPPVF